MVRFFRKLLRHPETLHDNNFMCVSDKNFPNQSEIDEFFNSRFRIGVYKPMGFFIDVNRGKYSISYNSEENKNIEVIDEFMQSF